MFSQRSWGEGNDQQHPGSRRYGSFFGSHVRQDLYRGRNIPASCLPTEKKRQRDQFTKKNTTLIICAYTRSGLVHIGTSAARSGFVHVLFTFSSWFVQV